jgi:hypothetical protein
MNDEVLFTLAVDIRNSTSDIKLYCPDHPAGVPRREHSRRDILGNHTARTYGSITADSYAGANNGTAAEPNIIANGDWCRQFRAFDAFRGNNGVVSRINLYVWAAHYIIANGNHGAIQYYAVKIHEEVFANLYVRAIVAIKRRLDINSAAFAQQLLQHGHARFQRLGYHLIVLAHQAAGVIAHINKLLVAGDVKLAIKHFLEFCFVIVHRFICGATAMGKVGIFFSNKDYS